MNIPLPRELEKLVERLVDSGRYSSAGDVVREALRLLDEREKQRKLRLSAMRKEIAKGVREARRGDHHDGDEVFDGFGVKAYCRAQGIKLPVRDRSPEALAVTRLLRQKLGHPRADEVFQK